MAQLVQQLVLSSVDSLDSEGRVQGYDPPPLAHTIQCPAPELVTRALSPADRQQRVQLVQAGLHRPNPRSRGQGDVCPPPPHGARDVTSLNILQRPQCGLTGPGVF